MAETGLPRAFLLDLILKTLSVQGEMLGTELAEALRLPFAVIEELLEALGREKLIEVNGAEVPAGAIPRYVIRSAGREQSREALARSRYIGPAPVPLADYTRQISEDHQGLEEVPADRLRAALAHLVLPSEILQQVGPALAARKAIFIYGAPGNGKTVLAEAIGQAVRGSTLVPHAVEMEQEVIRVYDPIYHGAEEPPQAAEGRRSPAQAISDRRWVRAGRPVVYGGGELTLEMLDLMLRPREGFYEAPLQMKANGGVFILDDFGRQSVRPRDLLNRWIVPLDKGVDHLTLRRGRRFPVPFRVLVIIATNLRPYDLVDEAFLRRVGYKIALSDPTRREYREIFRRECNRLEIPATDWAPEFLFREYYEKQGIPPRCCHPRDILEKVAEAARYESTAPSLQADVLERVCGSYFLTDGGDLEV